MEIKLTTKRLKKVLLLELSLAAVLSAILLVDVRVSILKRPLLQKALSLVLRPSPTPTPTITPQIFSPNGVELPIRFGNLGSQLVAKGVIDMKKMEDLYKTRGGMSDEMKTFLAPADIATIRMTEKNANELLNLLWAFGLANKNEILEKGPMMDKQYGGAGNFASTGGWTLSTGPAMNHYSKHTMVKLTPEQQDLVKRVSQNIYRPCCGNSTYFPDCNHGMAMLGLLELMAANGVSEQEMYRVALQVNSYWFQSTYETIAKYLQTKGKSFEAADPKELLGADYSSGQGFQKILQEVEPVKPSGGSCGV